MNLLIAILLLIVGAGIGSAVNLAVYRLAWHRRSYSPWSAADNKAPPRHWSDRIPVFGWFGLRREEALHGTGFWIRPMLVEVAVGVGLAALYWWEVEQLGLIRPLIAPPPMWVLLMHFAVHAFLLTLMLAGSLIDADEKTIPDSITVPGTVVGVAIAAFFPETLLPDVERIPGGLFGAQPGTAWDFLRLTSPNLWPVWLGGSPQGGALAIGLACWWGWCVALMPRTWFSRHGWCRAIGLSWARMRRGPGTHRALALGIIGSLAIAAVWWRGGNHWEGLLTALVGMAGGGGIIWSVRIVGTAVLHREAMGFGDVTLMAMIGAFLGWQACLIVFFLAPFAGLLVGLFILAMHRQSAIPYGPFLCLGAAFVLLRWCSVWFWAENLFFLGPIIPGIFLVGLVLMACLLWLWRKLWG